MPETTICGVWADPAFRLPFGMDHGRDVQDDTGTKQPGYRQRKL